jgi:hypothetical protein
VRTEVIGQVAPWHSGSQHPEMPYRTRRSFTRGMPRGLFGSIGLMAVHSWIGEFVAHDLSPRFWGLKSRSEGWPQRLFSRGHSRLKGRFWGEADINQRTKAAGSVENGPSATFQHHVEAALRTAKNDIFLAVIIAWVTACDVAIFWRCLAGL